MTPEFIEKQAETHSQETFLSKNKELTEKVNSLEKALTSLDNFDADLALYITNEIQDQKSQLATIKQAMAILDSQTEAFNHLVGYKVDTEQLSLPDKIKEFTQQVSEKLLQAAQRFDRAQNITSKIRQFFSAPIQRVSGQTFYTREKLFSPKGVIDNPMADLLKGLEVNITPTQEGIEELALGDLAKLSAVVEASLKKFPDELLYLEQFVEQQVVLLKLSGDAKAKLLTELKKKVNINSLENFKRELQKEIESRQRKLEHQESELVSHLEEQSLKAITFLDSIIQPQSGSERMPEGIWWTKEQLAHVVEVYNLLSNYQQKSEVTNQRRADKINTLLQHIEQKISEEIFQLMVTHKEKLDVSHSSDVLLHSSSDLASVLGMLTDGKLKSLGVLRLENGENYARSTDNLGGGKRHEQEIHQIYFNTLGKDETYPKGYTRNPYSPLKISTSLVADDPEIMALLKEETISVQAQRSKMAEKLSKYGIKEGMDHSRFLTDTYKTIQEIGGEQNKFGLGEIPPTFYIATGFFFLKKELLRDRQFTQTDGIAVFDGSYENTADSNFLQVDWQKEGCFVTDRLGWLVIKKLLHKQLTEQGVSEEIITQKIDEVQNNLVITDSENWGGQFVSAQNVFVGPYPSIQFDDGTTVSGEEIMFLFDYPYLDEADIALKQRIVNEQKGVTRFNEAYDQKLKLATDQVLAHLAGKSTQANEQFRIVPTMKKGDLPNASGSSKQGSIYKLVPST